MEQQNSAFDFVENYIPPEIRRENQIKAITKTAKHINIAVICALFLIIFFILLVFPHPKVSESENRALAEFPEFSFSALLSGEFTSDLSNYINDTVPFRESLVSVNSNIKALFGASGAGDDEDKVIFYNAQIITDPDVNADLPPLTTLPPVTTTISSVTAPIVTTAPNSDTPVNSEGTTAFTTTSQTTTTATTTAPPAPPAVTTTTTQDAVQDDGIISNGIVVLGDTGIMLYGGSYSVGQQYASYVNQYKADLGEGINVYSMVIPTAVSYYLPDEYQQYTGSQKNNIDNITQYLNGVANVDVYSALLAHKEEKIYTRTDHHWAALGAYYASQEFCKTANVPFLDISEYNKFSVDGYVGTLYTYTNEPSLLNNPEEFIYYKPKNENYTTTYYSQSFTNPSQGSLFNEGITNKSSLYLTFIRGDGNVVKINTGVQNGRKLIIFKDSYGNAIPGFLTGSFEEIYVCDMRYFELNSIDFIKQQGITDVLFASCAFSATGVNASHIEAMRTRQN